MCGINGFNWNDKRLIAKMNLVTNHRGPDDNGIFLDKGLSLGHLRLSILDLSVAGSQPMFYSKESGGCSEKYKKKNISKSKICVIFNGEIYNFKEIKSDLVAKGYIFTSTSDTEVILASYLEWGEDCVLRFDGMWAFCIYDLEKERLFFSRDRIGVKPLYYYWNDEKLIFSSEIKAILQHPIKREPNKQVIFDYLYYNFRNHKAETFFNNIYRLLPGHNMFFDLNSKKLKVTKYYDLELDLKNRKVKDFRNTLFKSIEEMLVSDVPVGTCLSGGLDSSLITCSINKLHPDYKLTCFSLVFPGEKFDESKYQKYVVDKCHANYKKTTFKETGFINDLEDFIYTHEEPISTTSFYGQYVLFKMIHKNKFKVILEGQGADEILGGYPWFYAYHYSNLFRKFKFISLANEVYHYWKNYNNFEPLKVFFSTLFPNFISEFIWKKRMNFINTSYFREERKINVKKQHWKAKSVKEMSILSEKYTQIPRLLDYGDKNSMRWSIESRVPFCDHNLVNCLINYPDEEKFKNHLTKGIIRDSMGDVLPKEILERKSKEGFSTPEKKVLQAPEIKKDFNRILNSDLVKKYPYIKIPQVKEMYYNTCAGISDNKHELVKIYLFFKWIERFIENEI